MIVQNREFHSTIKNREAISQLSYEPVFRIGRQLCQPNRQKCRCRGLKTHGIYTYACVSLTKKMQVRSRWAATDFEKLTAYRNAPANSITLYLFSSVITLTASHTSSTVENLSVLFGLVPLFQNCFIAPSFCLSTLVLPVRI